MRMIQVGLGPWGFDWARKVVPSVEGVTVVGRVDSDPGVRSQAARKLGEPEAIYHASLEDALAGDPAEAVLVTVPLSAHAAVVRAALMAGKHVLVEKPFTETVSEALALAELAESRSRVLMVSQNYRHFPAPLAAAEIVADRRFGALRRVAVDFHHNAAKLGYRYYHLAQPLLSDMSIHHFDLMRMVLGTEPETVSCRTWNIDGSRFVGPPAAEATVQFDGGAVVEYSGSWVSDDPPTTWAGAWRMEFDDAEVWWTSRGSEGKRFARDRLVVRGDGVDATANDLKAPPHLDRAGCLAAFRQAVETGQLPRYFSDGRDNANSLAIVEAAVISAETGQPAEIAEILSRDAKRRNG